jgi:hypothetical protein
MTPIGLANYMAWKLLTCNQVSPAILLHIARVARPLGFLLVQRGVGGVTSGSQHTAMHFLVPVKQQCENDACIDSIYKHKAINILS